MDNNNDEFELNFDDDIVDMTDVNYSQDTEIHGTYNNDIYGMYQPGRVYESEAEAIAAKRAARLKSKEKSEAVVNVLFNIAIWSVVGLAVLFRFLDIANYLDSYLVKYFLIPLFILVCLFNQIVVVIDICMMYSRYRRISLLLTGFLIFPVYPFVRNSARGESQSFLVLWLLLFFIAFFPVISILTRYGFLKLILG